MERNTANSPAQQPARGARRRFLRWGLWSVAALVVLGGLAAPWRPLSSRERRLVGTWVEENGDSFNLDHRVQLSENRRYHRTMLSRGQPFYSETGSWRLSGDRIVFVPAAETPRGVWPRLVWMVRRLVRPERWETGPITFEEQGAFRTALGGDRSNAWIPVPQDVGR